MKFNIYKIILYYLFNSILFVSFFNIPIKIIIIINFIIYLFVSLRFIEKPKLFFNKYNKIYLYYILWLFFNTVFINYKYFTYQSVFYILLNFLYLMFFLVIFYYNKNNIYILNEIFKIIYYSFIILTISSIYFLGIYNLNNRNILHSEFSPSIIGKYTSIISLFSMIYFLEFKKLFYIIYMILGFILLLLTFSKSSIISFFICSIIIISIYKKEYKRNTIIKILLIIILFIFIFINYYDFLYYNWSKYISHSKNFETFSGRLILWEKIYDFVKNNILFGFGYYSPRLILNEGFAWGNVYIGQAHNLIFHSLLNSGIIGTFLLLILIIKLLYKAKYYTKIKSKYKYIFNQIYILLLFLVIRSFSEASFAQEGGSDIILLNIIMASISFLERRF